MAAVRESENKSPDREDEKVLESIEDLRSEVRELRNMVNLLVEMIVSIEVPEDMEGESEGNMMGYDSLLKNGKYCM
ncbi:MAG TPA: hypothetical protein ENK47_03385 [Euryarchaeota archaeon]|nr:MAG: hypothetical protein DRN57_06250 [Thermoplasmata archaeon]HHD15731.1 hypothetical protein [Euryarchaeota archaeon]